MSRVTVESLLKKHMGLNISSIGQTALQNAINRRMRAVGCVRADDYLAKLGASVLELNELINEVAVNETWFFRDRQPFRAMMEFAITWRQRNPGEILRVLSIPCATGEEPYSIAISLLEDGWSPQDFQIDAVDISSRSIEKAERAQYSNHSFRGLSDDFRRRYFTPSDGGHVLSPRISRLVQFRKGNLIAMRPALNARETYQVIFCRNLLIYLDKASQEKAIGVLDNLLAPDGLLVVGHAEPGILSGSIFSALPRKKAFAFVRKKPAPVARPAVVAPLPSPAAMPPPAPAAPAARPAGPVRDALLPPLAGAEDLLRLNLPEQAARLCEDFLRDHGPNAMAYRLLGLIAAEKGEAEEAIRLLRRSIYLDPDNLPAMTALRDLLQQIGDTAGRESIQGRIERVRSRLGARPQAPTHHFTSEGAS